MKYLTLLLLASCVTSSTVEKRIGEGASCVGGYDNTYLCKTVTGKAYICYPESGGGEIYCFVAVDARDIK